MLILLFGGSFQYYIVFTLIITNSYLLQYEGINLISLCSEIIAEKIDSNYFCIQSFQLLHYFM